MDTFERYLHVRSEYLSAPLESSRLSLRQVRQAAERLSGNPNDIRLFGMRPLAWYAIGIRILGRTAIEATRDPQAAFLADAVANTLRDCDHEISEVIDPFAGSGNVLYHLARATRAPFATGIELDPLISRLTSSNFDTLRRWRRLRDTRVSIHNNDWSKSTELISDRPTLVILSPPWGDAFDQAGLDLRATQPPIMHLLARLEQTTGHSPIFVTILSFPKLVQQSREEIVVAYQTLPTLRPADPSIAARIDYLLLRLR